MSQTIRAQPIEDRGDYRPFESMGGFGIQDMFAVVGHDRSGSGVVLCAPADRELPPPSSGELDRWAGLRRHMLCGLRVQRTLGRSAAPDAVLDSTGRILHAEPLARTDASREVLRRHVVAIDRARSLARRDPAAALAAWAGLSDGTWSVIDTFDTDGRRYYLARRNHEEALSSREQEVLALASLGQSNKQIAYAIGLAPSTVSSHLRAAMRRVGVHNAAALQPVLARRQVKG